MFCGHAGPAFFLWFFSLSPLKRSELLSASWLTNPGNTYISYGVASASRWVLAAWFGDTALRCVRRAQACWYVSLRWVDLLARSLTQIMHHPPPPACRWFPFSRTIPSHFPPPPRYTLLAGVDRHFRMVSILRHLRQWHPDLTTVSSRCLKIAIQIYNQRRETTGKRGGKDTAYLYIYAWMKHAILLSVVVVVLETGYAFYSPTCVANCVAWRIIRQRCRRSCAICIFLSHNIFYFTFHHTERPAFIHHHLHTCSVPWFCLPAC